MFISAITVLELGNGVLRIERRDALIAATTLVHKMTIVTRNTADFEGTGAKLINPWEYANCPQKNSPK